MLRIVLNGGVIAAYVLLTRSGTPYSGKQWLLTEMITVPLIEETLWRGIVFAGLLLLLRRSNSEATSQRWAILLSGVAFGMLHLGNALFGVPVAFVAIQALNAIIWGIVYGYTRSKTESIYPTIVLHAAMNLIIELA